MIHSYKQYLHNMYATLSQPDRSEVPWKFSVLVDSFFDVQLYSVPTVCIQKDYVIMCDLHEFYERYQQQAQKYLNEVLQMFPFDHQWNMYAHVYAQKRWVVYIQPDVYRKDPIVLDLKDTYTEHVTIIVGQGAHAVVHEKMFAQKGKRIKTVDVILEQGAQLSFIAENNDAHDMLGYIYYRLFLYKDAQLTGNFALFGGKATMTMIDIEMCAPGAQATIKGLYTLDGSRQSIISTRQRHTCKQTMSNVVMKGIVSHQAHVVYHGTISIAKDAAQTEAYQENKTMVLSESAKVFSQPNLEIQTDDVRCKHGSAIGKFDADQVCYLQSRGLSLTSARKLLLKAFVDDVLHSDITFDILKSIF